MGAFGVYGAALLVMHRSITCHAAHVSGTECRRNSENGKVAGFIDEIRDELECFSML